MQTPIRWARADENLSVEDLGNFLDEPRVAVLATLRVDGAVLLSPVYHEWREGAFNVVIEAQNVKARHLRRDPRATILVAESERPLRGVEVRGSAQFIDDGVTETARRIVARYGDEEAEVDAEAFRGADVIVRLGPTTSGSGISPTSSTPARAGDGRRVCCTRFPIPGRHCDDFRNSREAGAEWSLRKASLRMENSSCSGKAAM